MDRQSSSGQRDASSGLGVNGLSFDVTADAVALRAERLAIRIPDEAEPGVALQLKALAAHAETAGLSVAREGDA
ncbi:MAG: hypothetical protein AAFR65_14490 [Pseudomonadota bacterium]